MGLLSAAMLARLRAFHAERLPDAVEVLNSTSTGRGLEGGTQRTGDTVAATYRGRIAAQKQVPAEVVEGGRPVAEQLYSVELEWGAAVKPTQRLRVNGRILRVVDVAAVESEAVVVSLVAVEVQ